MAESPTSAFTGGIEWLPALGGARLLRAETGPGEPPTLLLSGPGNAEHRVEPGGGTRFNRHVEYLVPGGIPWTRAALVWADGTRVRLPLPNDRPPPGELIDLRTRRTATPVDESTGTATEGERGAPPPSFSRAAPAPAASSSPARDAQAPGSSVPAAGPRPAHDAPAPASGSRPAADASAPTPWREWRDPGASWAARGPSGRVREAPGGPSWAEMPPGSGEGPRLVAAGSLDVPPAWTAPLEVAKAQDAAEDEWRARRAALEHELSRAAEALERVREGERAARDAVLSTLEAVRADLRAARAAREADASALATLTGELDAERSAHAVTRGTVETLTEALAAARAEAASLRADLQAERAGRASDFGLLQAAAARIDPDRIARGAREQAEAAAGAERRPSEQTGRLLADLSAAAASLRAAAPDPPAASEPTGAAPNAGAGAAAASPVPGTGAVDGGDRGVRGALSADRGDGGPAAIPPGALSADPGDGLGAVAAPAGSAPGARAVDPGDAGDAAAEDDLPFVPASRFVREREASAVIARGGAWSIGASEPAIVGSAPAGWSAAARPAPVVPAKDVKRLRKALVALAREDSVTAAALLAGLLPAQGRIVPDNLSYDVTIRGLATFGVTVEAGEARVRRLERPRPRGEARFHLAGDPLVLAELLAGERRPIRRFRGRARISGRRKDLRALRPLRQASLSLADAASAGARLEPALVFRALPYVVDPEWTRGHVFTVAQEIAELAPRAWHITARDGVPLTVAERTTSAAADATVTMTRAAFDCLLRGEPAPEGERPLIRGDIAAVEALRSWTDRARRDEP